MRVRGGKVHDVSLIHRPMGWFALGLGLTGCLMVLLPWGRWQKGDASSPLPTVGVLLAWVPFLVLVHRFVTNDLGVAVVNALEGRHAAHVPRGGHVVGTNRTALALGGIHRDPRLVVASTHGTGKRGHGRTPRGLLGGFAALLMLLATSQTLAATLPGSLPGELSPCSKPT